jgi:hypothetical protein
MLRIPGLSRAFVIAVGLTTTAHAQTTAYDPATAAGYGQTMWYGAQPSGGFGLEYAQPLAGGSVIMDQYGMAHGIPYTPYTESGQGVAPSRVAAPMRTMRSANRNAAQPRYRLPSGSLGATTTNGGILYSPAMRYQSYGSGYGYGPYGVTDYGYMWKGWNY